MRNRFIEHWYKRSQDESDFTNKFISLWISFNAFYASPSKPEIVQIEDKCAEYKELFKRLADQQNSTFCQLWNYIANKPSNQGFIQDMS